MSSWHWCLLIALSCVSWIILAFPIPSNFWLDPGNYGYYSMRLWILLKTYEEYWYFCFSRELTYFQAISSNLLSMNCSPCVLGFKHRVLKPIAIQICAMSVPPNGMSETWWSLFIFQSLIYTDYDEIHSCANVRILELVNNFMGLLSEALPFPQCFLVSWDSSFEAFSQKAEIVLCISIAVSASGPCDRETIMVNSHSSVTLWMWVLFLNFLFSVYFSEFSNNHSAHSVQVLHLYSDGKQKRLCFLHFTQNLNL